MANDFLLTFTVNGSQAISAMQQLGQMATQTAAQINALNSAGRGAVGGGGILNNLGLGASQLQGATRSMQSLADTVARMSASRQAASALGLQTGAGTLKAEAIATQQLSQQYGVLATRYSGLKNVGASYLATSQRLSGEAQNLAAQSRVVANQLDDTGQAFGRHARRVFEGILVYEAFGKAVQAVSAGIKLVIDIDAESRRLQAVLGATTTATAEFVQNIGNIASETVTSWEDLIANADTVAAAFLNIADPVERATAALELMRDVGKFTSITQHSVAEETTNLTAIMKQFNIPVEQMANVLGKIVVAGGNSSVVIADLTDALRLTAQAAEEAGITFDQKFAEILLAEISQFRIATGRTGTEIGNTFKILFTRMADRDVVKNVNDITKGMLQLRDATGAVRNPLVVLSELNALLQTGAITATQFGDVLGALAPPLQPARLADFKLIVRQLTTLGPIVDNIAKANAGDLDKLVAQINSALGPQFQKLIIDAQRAFTALFGPGIISLGQDLINVIRSIGEALSHIPAPVLASAVGFISLLAAWRLLVFAGKGLGSLFGVSGLIGSMRTVGAEAAVLSISSRQAAAGMAIFGIQSRGAAVLLGGLISQLKVLLPLIAVWMAIDFAGKVGEQQAALKGQIGGSLVGLDVEGLQKRRAELIGQINNEQSKINPLNAISNPFGTAGELFVLKPLQESLAEVDRQIQAVQKAGSGAKVGVDDLSEGFNGQASAADDAKTAMDDLQSTYQKMLADALGVGEGFASMTDAQKISAQSALLLAGLVDEQADALLKLNDRLKDGKINQSQWAAGQDLVNRSAKVAADLVAALGDGLRTMIPELANAGAGTDNLAGALFQMIVTSGDGIGVIESISNTILNLAAATGVAAAGLAGMTASAIGLAAITHAISTGQVSMFNFAALAALGRQAAAQAGQLDRAIAQLRGVFAGTGSKAFGVGGGGRAPSAPAAPPQTPLLDIGDLPPDQVAKLIALATTLRNAIPGETAADKNDLVALIKDGVFLQNIKGIDDRLLRIALEELTKTIQEQIDLQNKQEAVLSNLQVNAGSMGTLISQPNLFGVGGSIPSGMNFDPENGNFVVNIDIGSVAGLTPEQIAALVTRAVQEGIREGLRLQGVI